MNHNIGYLPVEIIESILGYLNVETDLYQCAMINKNFYRAVIPKLYYAPGAKDHYYNSCLFEVVPLLKTLKWSDTHPQPHLRTLPLGHHVRKLCIFSHDFPRDILKLLEHTPHLEDLSLKQQTIYDNDMKLIIQTCPNLVRLCLGWFDITDTVMESLARHCPHLRHLTLQSCHYLTPKIFEILTPCALESIELDNCNHLFLYPHQWKGRLTTIQSLSLSRVSPGTINELLYHVQWPKLTRFVLSHCKESPSSVVLKNDALVRLVQSHPLIERISLVDCFLSESVLRAMAKYTRHLRLLYLDYNVGLSGYGVRAVVKSCPNLTYVSMLGCSVSKRWFPEVFDEMGWVGQLGRKEIEMVQLGLDLSLDQEGAMLHQSDSDDNDANDNLNGGGNGNGDDSTVEYEDFF